MKKFVFAMLLGLTVVSGMINLSAPLSFAQEAPEPEPKPEKPGD